MVDISDGSHFQKTRIETDTRAEITTITESFYKVKFGHLPLMASTAKVRNFDNSILQIKGMFKSEVRMFGRIHQDVIHVVPDGHSCVIGMNFLTPLKVMLNCLEMRAVDREEFLRERPDEQIHAVRAEFADWTKEGIREEYPNLTQDSLGAFPDYNHEMTLKEGARPTACRARPVPLARRKARKVAAVKEQRNPALRSLFKQEEKVIVGLPHVRKKRMPPYSKPMTIIEVLGYYTYILDDGQKHNARRMKPWKEPVELIQLCPRQDLQEPKPRVPSQQDMPQGAPRRSSRPTRGRAAKRFDPCDRS